MCASGGGHRAREFKIEALQARNGEEKSWIPEREWKWWNCWERYEERAGGIWETWVVWGNCHLKKGFSPDQTLSPLDLQLLYFRGEWAPQTEPLLTTWGKKHPLICAASICPTMHQGTNTNGWEEGYMQARILRGDTWGTVLSATRSSRRHHKLLPTPPVPCHNSQSFPWGRIITLAPIYAAAQRGPPPLSWHCTRRQLVDLPSHCSGLSSSHLCCDLALILYKSHTSGRVYQGSW